MPEFDLLPALAWAVAGSLPVLVLGVVVAVWLARDPSTAAGVPAAVAEGRSAASDRPNRVRVVSLDYSGQRYLVDALVDTVGEPALAACGLPVTLGLQRPAQSVERLALVLALKQLADASVVIDVVVNRYVPGTAALRGGGHDVMVELVEPSHT